MPCGASSRASREPGVGYVVRPGPPSPRRRDDRTRRASTGATRWRCERWSPASAGSPPATAPSTRFGASAYIALEPTRGQDISFPFELAKRGLARRLRAGRAGQRADGADDRGRVPPQAPDDGRRLEHDAQHGDALAARLQPAVRAGDLLAPAASLRDPDPPPRRARHQPRPASGEGAIYAFTLVAQGALLVAALLGRLVPFAPLLVARYYVAVTAASAVGLWDLLRHGVPADLGERGGHAGEGRRSAPLARRHARGLVLLSPVLLAAAIAIKLDSRGPVIYRQRRAGLRRRAASSCGSCGRCSPAPTRSASGRPCSRAIRA